MPTTTLTTLPDWCADVLITFKVENGRKWRAILDDMYASGKDEYARNKARQPIGPVLRSVRNHPMRDAILALVK